MNNEISFDKEDYIDYVTSFGLMALIPLCRYIIDDSDLKKKKYYSYGWMLYQLINKINHIKN